MPAYNQMPVRLQADLISQPPVIPIDANTGLPIQLWARTGIAIGVGIFDALGVGVDLSNVTFLTLTISESASSLVPSVTKTVLAGALIPYITRADWLAQINQNATFIFSNAEMDLSLDGADEATYWLSLQGQTTGGANIVYAAGAVRIFNPGPGIPQPTRGLVSYHSTPSAGGNLVIQPASNVHTEVIPVSGAAEVRDVVVLATGLEAGARVGLRFALPATNGLSHRLFDQSLAGALLATITCDPDGFTPAAKVDLFFDGVNLKRDTLIIPAFGQQT
jgi:hypothetical protein